MENLFGRWVKPIHIHKMPISQEFKKLRLNLRKEYLGKPVPMQYQNKYGKRYDQKDINSLSYAIARSRGIKTERRSY